jgi:hypothetical protein
MTVIDFVGAYVGLVILVCFVIWLRAVLKK